MRLKDVQPSAVFARPNANRRSVGLPERWMCEVHALTARLEGSMRLRHPSGPTGPAGPLIEFRASLLTSGVRVFVSFRNRLAPSGPPTSDIVRSLVLLPAEERLELQLDRAVRSIGGPAIVSLQLLNNADGVTLTEVLDIGECKDLGTRFQVPFSLRVSTTVWFAARDRSERGAIVGVGGQVSVPRGLSARLLLRPLAAKRRGIGEGAAELPLVRPGQTWLAPDRTFESGSPKHNWVFARLAEAGGRGLCDEKLIGQCVQLPVRS